MIAVIDYGASNLQSIGNALKQLGVSYRFVSDADGLSGASGVILPGVGAAKIAMRALRQSGFATAIQEIRVPFLGICLGLQLLSDFSEEGSVPCLSIIPGRVKKFPNNGLKVPHMGWNMVESSEKLPFCCNLHTSAPLLRGIPNCSAFYFVHSYYFDAPENVVIGRTLYGISFPSILARNNFFAVQFHPEKSGKTGLILLRNFCELCS